MSDMNGVEASEYLVSNAESRVVEEMLAQGWRLYGPPVMGRTGGFYQALIRPPKPKPEPEPVPDPSQNKLPLGIEVILEEYLHARERYTPEHDMQHSDGMLAAQAAELLVEGTEAWVDPANPRERDAWGLVEKHKHEPMCRLMIAGALVAAEIERLQKVQG